MPNEEAVILPGRVVESFQGGKTGLVQVQKLQPIINEKTNQVIKFNIIEEVCDHLCCHAAVELICFCLVLQNSSQADKEPGTNGSELHAVD